MLHTLTKAKEEKGNTKIKQEIPCLICTYTTMTLNVENLALFECNLSVYSVEYPDIVSDREAPHPFPQRQIRLV